LEGPTIVIIFIDIAPAQDGGGGGGGGGGGSAVFSSHYAHTRKRLPFPSSCIIMVWSTDTHTRCFFLFLCLCLFGSVLAEARLLAVLQARFPGFFFFFMLPYGSDETRRASIGWSCNDRGLNDTD
jgi:hypothetical protein